MAAQGIDVLVMQNNNDHMGGYVKYVTDLPAVSGYPFTVIFPADDLMTLVRMGAFGGELDLSTGTDPFHRGVKRILMTPSFASAPYTNDYDAELAVKALAPYAKGTIGLVGKFPMSAAFADYLRKSLTTARFVDATDMVDSHQGGEKPGRDRAHSRDGALAGRRHARGVCGHQARHARPRGGRGGAILQPLPRQRAGRLQVRLGAGRHRHTASRTGTSRTA